MKRGDVVLAKLPQADGSLKPRPVIILREMPPFRDLLVCGISTQLHQQVAGFDETISPSDPDFAGSGLQAPSLIRLGFLTVEPRQKILGSIGAISPERHKRLLQTLSDFLVK